MGLIDRNFLFHGGRNHSRPRALTQEKACPNPANEELKIDSFFSFANMPAL
jgi:hypothetical protein